MMISEQASFFGEKCEKSSSILNAFTRKMILVMEPKRKENRTDDIITVRGIFSTLEEIKFLTVELPTC